MVSTEVTLCGERLENPVIPASGTFGYGHEFAEIYDINCLGAFAIKGTTAYPRFGNPTPRIADAPGGMLNAVGLQNPGVEDVIHCELPKLAAVYKKRVVANVCGFSLGEYVSVAEMFDSCEQVGWIELNVSCPNVHGGGMGFGTTAEGAAAVTREVKRVVKKPVIVKLTPNVTDIVPLAQAAERGGANGLTMVNTLTGLSINLRTRRPVLANVTGGLSGPALKPMALRMIHQVRAVSSLPIIGVGGIESAEDVLEFMMAGANAVEVGAASFHDPLACPRIAADLPLVMDRYGINKLTDLWEVRF